MSDWRAVPLFDRSQLIDFAAFLPEEHVRQLIRGLADELANRPPTVVSLAGEENFDGARRAVHLLRGVALNLGATRIAALAGAIEDVTDDEIPALAHCLSACARDTLIELHAIEATLFRADRR